MTIFTSCKPNIDTLTGATNAGPGAGGGMTRDAAVKTYLCYANTLHVRVTKLEQEDKKSPNDRMIKNLAASARILVQDYNALRDPVVGLNTAINAPAGLVTPISAMALKTQTRANYIYDDLGRRIEALRYKHAPNWGEWLGKPFAKLWATTPNYSTYLGAAMLTYPLWKDQIFGIIPGTFEAADTETVAGAFKGFPQCFPFQSNVSTTIPNAPEEPAAALKGFFNTDNRYLDQTMTFLKDHQAPITYGIAALGGSILASRLAKWAWHKIAYAKPTLDTNHELRIKFIDVMPNAHSDDIKDSITMLEEAYKSAHERFLRLKDRVDQAKKNPQWLYPTLYADWEVVNREASTLKEAVDTLQDTLAGHMTFNASLAELDTQVNTMCIKLIRIAEGISWNYYAGSLPRRFTDSLTRTQILGLCILPVAVGAEVARAITGNQALGSAAHATAALTSIFLLGQPVAEWCRTDPVQAHWKQVKEHGTVEPHFPIIAKISDFLSRKDRTNAIHTFSKEVNRLEREVVEMIRKVKGGVVQDDTLKVDLKTLEFDWNALGNAYFEIDCEMRLAGESSAELDSASDRRCELGTAIVRLRKLVTARPKKAFAVARTALPSKRPSQKEKKATILSQKEEIHAAERILGDGKPREAVDAFKGFVFEFQMDCKDLQEHVQGKRLEDEVLKANFAILMDDYRKLTRLANLIEEKLSAVACEDEIFNRSRRALNDLANTLHALQTRINALKDDKMSDTSTALFSKTTKVAVPCIALSGATLWLNEIVEQWGGSQVAQYAPLAFCAIATTAIACKAIGWLWGERSSSSTKTLATAGNTKPKQPLLPAVVAEARTQTDKESATPTPAAVETTSHSEDVSDSKAEFEETKRKEASPPAPSHGRKKFTSGVEKGTYALAREIQSHGQTFSLKDAQLPVALCSVINAFKKKNGILETADNTLETAVRYGAYKHAKLIKENYKGLSDPLTYLQLLSREKAPAPFTIDKQHIFSADRSKVDFEKTLAQMDVLRSSQNQKQIIVPVIMRGVPYVLGIDERSPGGMKVVLSGVHPHPHVLGVATHFRKTFSSLSEAGQCLAAMSEELSPFVAKTASNDIVFYPCIPLQPIGQTHTMERSVETA